MMNDECRLKLEIHESVYYFRFFTLRSHLSLVIYERFCSATPLVVSMGPRTTRISRIYADFGGLSATVSDDDFNDLYDNYD